MRIITWNMNGLMSSIAADCFMPIKKLKSDCLCLQEIRTTKEPVILPGYQHHWNHGTRKGYAGTASLSRVAPIRVTLGYGAGADIEGRVITSEFNQFYLVNIYSPNFRKNLARQAYRSKLIIPDVLLNGKLPDNAVFELERHMEYVIKKYGL